jgi:flagellar motility protein MotE (MotC chaperone)
MRKFLEKLVVLFLLSLVTVATLVIIGFLDYTGFINIHSTLPEIAKKNKVVSEYIRMANINSLAPRDQKSVLLEEKQVYVENLFKQMKIESTRILEEKKKLEQLFRTLEEEKEDLKGEQGDFLKEIKKEEEARQIKENKALIERLDNLAATYAKMLPEDAAKILDQIRPIELSFEVLRRLTPKALGAILSNLEEARASMFVRMLQSSEPKSGSTTQIEMIATP